MQHELVKISRRCDADGAKTILDYEIQALYKLFDLYPYKKDQMHHEVGSSSERKMQMKKNLYKTMTDMYLFI